MKNKHLIINLFFALIAPSIAYAEINQEINYKTRGEESSSFISKQIIFVKNGEGERIKIEVRGNTILNDGNVERVVLTLRELENNQ